MLNYRGPMGIVGVLFVLTSTRTHELAFPEIRHDVICLSFFGMVVFCNVAAS